MSGKIDAHVTVTMGHPDHGCRVIYAGSFRNILKSGIFANPAYINAFGEGCCLIIKGVTEEERIKAIEKLEFEGSVTNSGDIRKWKE